MVLDCEVIPLGLQQRLRAPSSLVSLSHTPACFPAAAATHLRRKAGAWGLGTHIGTIFH